MFGNSNRLRQLAAQVRRGDPEATAAFREELERQIPFMVRRVMRTGVATSSLDRRILAETDRLAPYGWDEPGVDCEELIRAVACQITESVIGNLHADGVPSRMVRDTVCA